MEFGPDSCTRTPYQQPYGFAAVAKSQHEQPRAAILAGLRVAHHRTCPVIDLCFLSRCGEDDPHSLWRLRSAKLANEALHRLVASSKALVGDQVLPDGLAIAPSRKPLLDQLTVWFTGT